MKTGAVLVTGASTGIGRACALYLEALGFQVFAGVRSDHAGALLQEATTGLTPVQLDVTQEDSIAAAVARIDEAVGNAGLAGLVNNAGIAIAGPLEFLPLAEFRRQLEVNVTGQLAVTQACLPLLRLGQGRIVNMGSIGGRLATPLLGPYCASKFAMEGLTDALRLELRSWDIKVSLIEPGTIATPIWNKSLVAAEELFTLLPLQAQDLYRDLTAAAEAMAREGQRTGAPPLAVARAVAHALTAPSPRTRYVVGRAARVQALLTRIVPDRLRDRLISQVFARAARAGDRQRAASAGSTAQRHAVH